MHSTERDLAAFQRAFDVRSEFEISIRLAVCVFELGQIPANNKTQTCKK